MHNSLTPAALLMLTALFSFTKNISISSERRMKLFAFRFNRFFHSSHSSVLPFSFVFGWMRKVLIYDNGFDSFSFVMQEKPINSTGCAGDISRTDRRHNELIISSSCMYHDQCIRMIDSNYHLIDSKWLLHAGRDASQRGLIEFGNAER